MEFVTDERNSDFNSSFRQSYRQPKKEDKISMTVTSRTWKIGRFPASLSVSWANLGSQYDSSSDNEDSINEDWTDAVHPIDIRPFTEDVGPTHNLPTGASPIHYFNLMFDDRFFKTIADQTNLYTEQQQQQNGTADTRWNATTIEEVRAFFSLQICYGNPQSARV